MSRIPPTVVAAVHERANGHCEACSGVLDAAALHHRLPLSAGGPNTVANLMLVHGGFDGGCHNLNSWSIHGRPARSYRLGHLVHRGVDPATVPVIVEPRLRSVLL